MKKLKWKAVLKNFVGALFPSLLRESHMPRHRDYVYFQDFVPNAEFDIRVNVVGNRANGMIRFVRANDFRASGSGNAKCDQTSLGPAWIRCAFDCAKKAAISAGAFDFILGHDGNVKIVEVSYGYGFASGDGWWSPDLVLHKEPCNVAEWMLDLVIEKTMQRDTLRNGI